jgi:hypothetical protein
MAQHNINITTSNQTLGIPVSSDGVMGLICKAVAVAVTFDLDKFYLLTKLDDLAALGIDAAYDTTNSVAVYKHVSEFYAQAGDGAYLWIAGISKATAFATYINTSGFKTMIKGTGSADPNNLIKVIGLAFDVPAMTQSSQDFPTDVLASVSNLQTVLKQLEASNYFLAGVIDGYNMSTSVTPSTLCTQATNTAYKVCLIITGTQNNHISSIGQYLGKLARIDIGTSPGKVLDGSLAQTLTTQYLTNGTDVKTLNDTDFNALGTKQYVFAMTIMGYSGYFYNDGATCTAVVNALSTIEANRIANSFCQATYNFLIAYRESTLPVDKAGNLDSGFCANVSSLFYSQYIAPAITAGTLVAGSLSITGLNFNANRTITYILSLQKGNTYITVNATIQFVNSLI